MSVERCLTLLQQAAGRGLTDEEVEYVFTEVRKRRDHIKARGEAATLEEAALRAADEVSNNIQLATVIEKRNKALNTMKAIQKIEWAKSVFGTRGAEAMETMLVGSNRAVEGARDGVSQIQKALRNHYLTGFVTDLTKADVHPLFTSGTLDREVSRALWAFGKPDEKQRLAQLPEAAVTIGRIVNKWQELARIEANKEGAWIGKMDGYIVRQSHDPVRIQRAGIDAWKDAARKYFDIARMTAENPERDVESMLNAFYINLASGNHMKAVPDQELQAAFKGPANLAKKMSQSREIHFKDADAWFDYNQVYGNRNLREAVTGGLTLSAEKTGLLRSLGTNPQSMLQTIAGQLTEHAKASGDVEQVTRISERIGRRDMYMAAVDGSMNQPGSAIWARRMSNIRGWETLAKLGGMIASQLNDIAIYGASMQIQGRGFLSGMGEAVAGIGKGFKSQERQDLLSSLDVFMESMVGEIGRTGSFNEAGGMSRAVQLFMKLNLSQYWTERLRAAAAEGMSHHMALQKTKPWAAIGDEYQRTLSVYGIGERQWEQIRTVATKHVDGRDYITPEMVRDIPDSRFGGGDAAAYEKGKLEQQLRNYFVDRVGFAVIDPDDKTRALMLQGTKPGTWTGEMARFVMQFKSFTGSYMQKAIGQQLYGRGYMGDSIIGALRNGNGEMLGIARLIATTTLMGYASLTIKDLFKNRTPRDITQPEIGWKVLLASMVQGGGAGIYGDFLFGEASRFGSGTVETIAGPTISEFGSALDLYHKALRGDTTAAAVFRQAMNNTPYLNLFYARMTLDYLILNDFQEWLTPGYMRRMERQLEKDNAQQFLVRPQ